MRYLRRGGPSTWVDCMAESIALLIGHVQRVESEELPCTCSAKDAPGKDHDDECLASDREHECDVLLNQLDELHRMAQHGCKPKSKADPAIWVTDPDSEARRAARGMAFISRESEAYQYAWSKGYDEALHDNIEALGAHERAKAEPDYRAMWEDLRGRIADAEERWLDLCTRSAGDPENAAFRRSRWSTFETVAWWMDSALERAPDPTHTPAVRWVVAWEAASFPDEPFLDRELAYREQADTFAQHALEARGRSWWEFCESNAEKAESIRRWGAAYLRHRDERAGYR